MARWAYVVNGLYGTDCAEHIFTATDRVHRACAADKKRESVLRNIVIKPHDYICLRTNKLIDLKSRVLVRCAA
jgi:hypothetical protein